ncbi:MAG: hypothetical protein M1819_001971 [Sarea resinae]|nr:MAG: hypothetical protein M1819_001971 [Sarea resinae]
MTLANETYRPAFPPSTHDPTKPNPHISYGVSFPAALAHHAAHTYHAKRIYVLLSSSLSRNTDTLGRIENALRDEGVEVAGVRRGMQPHTLFSELLEVVRDIKDKGAVDLLVTVGAGSLTDAGKIITLALANNAPQTPSSLLALSETTTKNPSSLSPPTIPQISIPTSLSGGEYSPFGGGTSDTTHQKHMFSTPAHGPSLVILSPELTITTPASVFLSTGIRAVDHCIETVCSLSSNDAADADAAAGLRALVPGLLKCKSQPDDLEARLACQMGVIEAMKSVSAGVPLGASHGIGHQLGPLGIGHGETSCILLPAVCRYNARVNAARQEKVVHVLLGLDDVAALLREDGKTETGQDLAGILDSLIRTLGLPRSLKDKGVELTREEELDQLAANCLRDRMCATNPVPLVEKSQVREILAEIV